MKFKYLFILIIIPFLLLGCSKNSVSVEDANKVIESISLPNLEKVDYTTENKALTLYIKEEFISKEDIDNIVSNIAVNKETGYSALTKENFNNIVEKIELVSSNKNTAMVHLDNPKEIIAKLDVNKYSEQYIRSKLRDISLEITTLNELAGQIETSLKQNNLNKEAVEKFNVSFDNLNFKIDKISNISSYIDTNFDFTKYSELLSKTKNYAQLVKQGVDSAVSTNNSNSINANFLNINELDKIAREIL